MEMPSMNYMPAELASYNRRNTSCSNSVNGRNTCNTDHDISSSAVPPIIRSTSILSPSDKSPGCGSASALNTTYTSTTTTPPSILMRKASDDSAAAPPADSHVDDDPPAGVNHRVRAVRRMENTISRQVTFCKRRTRLFKKAYELAVLGDAEVAVIAISPTGRTHHYASSSMSHILQRYRDWRISKGIPPAPADHLSLQDIQFWRHKAFRLREHIKHLTDLHRYLMGENLSFLPFPDIIKIETTLDAALYKTRLRKMELLQLQDQTTAQKESLSHIQEENEFLKRKLAEITAIRHGPNKSSNTIGVACSTTDFESNAQLMKSCRAAHTSDDDDCHAVMLELGL